MKKALRIKCLALCLLMSLLLALSNTRELRVEGEQIEEASGEELTAEESSSETTEESSSGESSEVLSSEEEENSQNTSVQESADRTEADPTTEEEETVLTETSGLEESEPEQSQSNDISLNSSEKAGTAKVEYRTYLQTFRWQPYVQNGMLSGMTGQAKRIEALEIRISDTELEGNVEYRVHAQTYGWMPWVSDGAVSGTVDQAKRIEAVQIRLTGELAETYDIYYRLHVQTYGWLGWAKNGEAAGTAGLTKRAEAIEICLVEKGGAAPGSTNGAYIEDLRVTYTSHAQTYGWLSSVFNGETSGTVGEEKRLEAVQIKLENHSLIPGNIEYRVHCQTYGWMEWVSNGATAGTTGQTKRLEAIQIRLTGEMAEKYDIYYRVHCQTFGWTGWACNGASAGSEAYAKRMEAIEIQLVEKGGEAPGSTSDTFYKPQFWGIDVSSWQGSINWNKVKADGADFAMLRITQKNTTETAGRLMKDRYFDANARGALVNGIEIGGYVYIYSSTPEEAREDAEYALSLIEGYDFTYPIAFDLEEEEHMTAAAKLNNMAMAREFCKVFQDAGYKTCIYGSPSKLKDAFDYSSIAASYDIWLARYRWSDDVLDFSSESMRQMVYDTGYEGGNWTNLTNVQIWQFTSSGRVDGISGNVDLDLCYKVY